MSVLLKIIFISIVSTHVVESASLICYLGSINNTKELPLKQALEFLDTPYIKRDKELIMITHGYLTVINKLYENVIINYMNRYGDTKCYCAFNWKSEASGILKNISALAITVGTVLVQLGIVTVTLIGHSQGALLFGDAGRKYYEITGTYIAVIIGLDPAGKSGWWSPVEEALDTTCASFVWCLHTDPTMLGTNEAKCHVDIYANYGCRLQPGCPPSTGLIPDKFLLCSSSRAVLIMTDAVKFIESLLAVKADNYNKWMDGHSDADDVISIGPNIKSSKRGSYFLSTNAASPFGRGSAGIDPANRTCKSNTTGDF